ncbi:hypothetical protein KSS87_019715 [Heliosperma pusillum]|nr:hypothetical protein KSS87_019715 [Heliosperma pusillum]
MVDYISIRHEPHSKTITPSYIHFNLPYFLFRIIQHFFLISLSVIQ